MIYAAIVVSLLVGFLVGTSVKRPAADPLVPVPRDTRCDYDRDRGLGFQCKREAIFRMVNPHNVVDGTLDLCDEHAVRCQYRDGWNYKRQSKRGAP